jgi:hypothetical protein
MATATETYRYARLHIVAFDIDVPVVIAGRTAYFPIKAFCEALGLAGPSMQIKRLREDTRFAGGALRELPIPTIKGLHDATCLRKQQLSKWLIILDTSRAQFKTDIRARLEEFQSAVFAAADRFLFGDTSDVVASDERAIKPVYGVLHLGDCPRCGLALCLTLDETGQHLVPDTTLGVEA